MLGMKVGVVAVLVLMAGAVRGEVPFTVGKETTFVVEPLKQDGTPDYIGALNMKYGVGVKREENAFAVWLEVVDWDKCVNQKTQGWVSLMTGVRKPGEGVRVWMPFYEYLREVKRMPEAQRDVVVEAFEGGAQKRVWDEVEFAEGADYVAWVGPLLDKVEAGMMRPKWWSPCVSSEGESVMFVVLPSLGTMRDMANVMACRAMLRLGHGDFGGYLQDALAIKRMARHLENGVWLIDRLVGVALSTIGDRVIGMGVGSGKLTEEQCEVVAKEIAGLPAAERVGGCVLTERYNMLDTVVGMAMADEEKVKAMDPNKAGIAVMVQSVDRKAIVWDVVLRRVNASMDELEKGLGAESYDEAQAAMEAFGKQLTAWANEAGQQAPGLGRKPEEGREAYSERVGRYFMAVVGPSMNKVPLYWWRARMEEEMVGVMVGAAKEKARTGAWPARVEGLPVDVYRGKGAVVKYGVMGDGARVWSVGRNGSDENGAGDDVVVGWRGK